MRERLAKGPCLGFDKSLSGTARNAARNVGERSGLQEKSWLNVRRVINTGMDYLGVCVRGVMGRWLARSITLSVVLEEV